MINREGGGSDMKRWISVCLIVCILLILSICYAYAATIGEIETLSDNYSSAKATLSITNGQATASGKLYGLSGVTTKATVHLYLQQYRNGEWVNYEDWLKSNEGTNCTVTKTISVPKGYTYRAKASCYAYAGSNSEHVIKYSSEVRYY